MNYLAHAFLSFQHPEILVGNIISDFVKGKKRLEYPAGIRQGITLHRILDRFTDAHPATRQAKSFFRSDYRLYAGAFVDVVYDHFLAADATEFSADSLMAFTQQVYATLDAYQAWLPERFILLYVYMKKDNWLYHYRTTQGAEKSFGGVVRRAKYLDNAEPAIRIFHEYYSALQQCYHQFWQAVKPFARTQWKQILHPGG
jgi:acyl carrier protein phosphodiesterase